LIESGAPETSKTCQQKAREGHLLSESDEFMRLNRAADEGQGNQSTVVVDHLRLGRVKMNTSAYDLATCGPIFEGPTHSILSVPHAQLERFKREAGVA
jgi:hypothetical protein